eukprot:213581-Rhodomonas_salina.1
MQQYDKFGLNVSQQKADLVSIRRVGTATCPRTAKSNAKSRFRGTKCSEKALISRGCCVLLPETQAHDAWMARGERGVEDRAGVFSFMEAILPFLRATRPCMGAMHLFLAFSGAMLPLLKAAML